MQWLRDPVWQQGVAILLLVAGSVLNYTGAAGGEKLGGSGVAGLIMFGLGVALPLLSQLLSGGDEDDAQS